MFEIKQIEASQTWYLRSEVMYKNASIDLVKLPNDTDGTHFGLFFNEELVSVVSLFIYLKTGQFRKLATKESHQNKGFGSMLLKHVFNYAIKNNCNKIWCNARENKSSFYQKFEMHETTNKFRKNNIEYVIMEKLLY